MTSVMESSASWMDSPKRQSKPSLPPLLSIKTNAWKAKSIYGIRSTPADWKELLTNRVVATPAVLQAVGEELRQRPVTILPESWHDQMSSLKVTTAKDVLTTAKLKGYSEGSTLIPAHASMLEQDLAFLSRAGFDTTVAVCVFQSLDPNAPLGEYVPADDRVLLNLRTFELGLRQLIECLVEEFLHRKSGECDKTRNFQNALIRELVEVIVRLTGETL